MEKGTWSGGFKNGRGENTHPYKSDGDGQETHVQAIHSERENNVIEAEMSDHLNR